MIIYKSETLDKLQLEHINYFKHAAMCEVLDKYNITQGIFKFEIQDLDEHEINNIADTYHVNDNRYNYPYQDKSKFITRKELIELLKDFKHLVLKIEPKSAEDIHEINYNLYLTENINIIKATPSCYKGDQP